MLKKLLNPTVKDICPNCGHACEITDVLCPNCGENLDELFEQLPETDVRPSLLMKFITGVFGILLGLLIPIAVTILAVSITLLYGSIYDTGIFIQWRSLGNPPGRVTKLLGTCGYGYAVCVQTDNQKIYTYMTYNCDNSSKSCWEQLKQPVIEEPHLGSCWFRFAEKNPPKGAIQIIKTNDCGSGGAIQTNYALLADGSVWVWKHTVSDLVGLSWFMYAIPVALIAFIVGIGLAFEYMPVIWRKLDNYSIIKAA